MSDDDFEERYVAVHEPDDRFRGEYAIRDEWTGVIVGRAMTMRDAEARAFCRNVLTVPHHGAGHAA